MNLSYRLVLLEMQNFLQQYNIRERQLPADNNIYVFQESQTFETIYTG